MYNNANWITSKGSPLSIQLLAYPDYWIDSGLLGESDASHSKVLCFQYELDQPTTHLESHVSDKILLKRNSHIVKVLNITPSVRYRASIYEE